MTNTTITINWEKLIDELRIEAEAHIDKADLYKGSDTVWTARLARAHVLFGLADALGRSILYVPSED